jgi:hypothetical protein
VEREIVPVSAEGSYVDADGLVWHVCRNLNLSGCTWLARLEGRQCWACDLTRTRPADQDLEGLENFAVAERAKRHLLVELDALDFPVVSKVEDPVNGLCFDLLSSVGEQVTIGHAEGVITIDLAESEDSHREYVREQLDEPYRTMLGHFRHEVGHYFEWQLLEREPDQRMERARELFGDERVDYQETIDRHYSEGAPEGWENDYISSYATMHPYEDFAETWAHYLHICDAVETAASYGLIQAADLVGRQRFRDLVTAVWMPLSIALNLMNQSMGQDDLYPFVIGDKVLTKLDFVASLRPSVG